MYFLESRATRCGYILHACDKKLIFFLKFNFFPKIVKIQIKHIIYVFLGIQGYPVLVNFALCDKKSIFFLYIFFYRDCGTFLKKVNLKKNFYFLTRTCKIHQHWIPIGSPIIYKFCVLQEFWHFLEKSKNFKKF